MAEPPFRTCWLRIATGLVLGSALVLACTTPLELGERRYREGDRLEALETWRRIEPSSLAYEAAQRRIAQVEREFEQLVVRYRQQGRYYERKGRLAESVLSYRLALKLQPEDSATLSRVQKLVRLLARRRAKIRETFRERFAAGDLAGARRAIATLRRLDPFSPQLQADQRSLEAELHRQVARSLARGRRSFSRGALRAAERAFRRVLELDPDNESAQGYLAYVERIRSEARRGSPVIAAAGPPEVDASDAEIRAEGFYRNALAAERAGDPYAAIRFDLAALQANPEHRPASQHLTALRRKLGPDVPGLIEAGRQRYQQEDLQAALDHWRRALLIEPGNGQARSYARHAEHLVENLQRLRNEPPPQVGSDPPR